MARGHVKLAGRSIESLTLAESWQYAGTWVALELYTPERVPLRVIKATGRNAAECATELAKAGHDPFAHEYQPITQPYKP